MKKDGSWKDYFEDPARYADAINGFKVDSKLIPVVTFVLYSGENEWTGPICLHDIIDFADIPKSMQKYVANYANVKGLIKAKEYCVDDGGRMNMCTAIKEMINDGKEQEIVELCREFGKSKEETILKLMERLNMNKEEAEKRLEVYWK